MSDLEEEAVGGEDDVIGPVLVLLQHAGHRALHVIAIPQQPSAARAEAGWQCESDRQLSSHEKGMWGRFSIFECLGVAEWPCAR